ncbi:MAG TPA: hypothetical protein VF602_07535 [Pedobacter sp.]|jgi:hypothetical protein
MKRKQFLKYTALLVFLLISTSTFSQSVNGVIYQKGSATRVTNASVFNVRLKSQILTDIKGSFSIMTSPGDTLLVNHPDYMELKFVVANYNDIIIHLQRSNLLNEVVIKGESRQEQLAEAERSFKKKGIFYKGRPPLLLLSPFGGSPLTFFHELLSKDGRNARRFSRFAQSEGDYYEVASRFNDYNIKKVIPIKDHELPHYKEAYWPSVDQIRSWKDFDLFNYIKKSYSKFLNDRVVKDSLVNVK